MADDDIFVKRVDFELNNNQPPPNGASLAIGDALSELEKAKEPEKNPTCTSKFCDFLEKFGIKSALSHIGLLISLGLFCLGGGWVRCRSAPEENAKVRLPCSNFSGLYHAPETYRDRIN